MSEKKYTLTLYIAPPGGKRVDDEGNLLPDSGPGHVYYAIQETGGEKKAYGFSPSVEFDWGNVLKNKGFDLPGHAVPNEHRTYANPAYMRTMEISKEQYEKLQAFGEASLDRKNHATKVSQLTNGQFSTEKYNVFDNSCIDYVFHALRYSGVYNHQKIKPSSELNEYGEVVYKLINDDGKLNVLNNAEIFNKIPLRTVGKIHDETANERKKAPIQYKFGKLNIRDFSPTTQKLAQQFDEKFAALCESKGITASCKDDFVNLGGAAVATALANGLPNIEKVDIDSQTRMLWLGSYHPRTQLASLSVDEAVNIPISESMAKIHTIEQQNAQQTQERQMAQSQQQNHGLQIG